MQNPFNNTYGIKPKQYVLNNQSEEILENFSYEDPTERSYMITGVRGSGKTVMLTDISEKISKRDEWTVIKIVPSGDMLQSLASKLYSHPVFKSLFVKAKIDISFLGIGVSLEKDADKFFNLETAVERMLEVVKRSGKKILLTIDEAEPGKEMERFCLAYQGFIREEYPVYLIMTGLHNKINDIQRMNKCTFLSRTPKIIVAPLDETDISASYKKVFHIDSDEAAKMAALTKGYAYAFQTLGRLYFDKETGMKLEDIIEDYERELIRYSYKTIWSELSRLDIEVVKGLVALNGDEPVKREALMSAIGFSSSMMNEYKDRLQESGIINITDRRNRGYYWFVLPRFSNFVRDYHM